MKMVEDHLCFGCRSCGKNAVVATWGRVMHGTPLSPDFETGYEYACFACRARYSTIDRYAGRDGRLFPEEGRIPRDQPIIASPGCQECGTMLVTEESRLRVAKEGTPAEFEVDYCCYRGHRFRARRIELDETTESPAPSEPQRAPMPERTKKGPTRKRRRS